MNLFLTLAYLFFIGSVLGWVLELFYRRFISGANPERKWINPGFCVGPYVPLYGFGLCILFVLAAIGDAHGVHTGYFFGVFTIDVVYSAHLVTRIRQFAKENEVDIKLEQLKAHIRRRQDERREKVNFLFAFRSSHSLAEHLREAQDAWEERHKAEKK